MHRVGMTRVRQPRHQADYMMRIADAARSCSRTMSGTGSRARFQSGGGASGSRSSSSSGDGGSDPSPAALASGVPSSMKSSSARQNERMNVQQ